MAFDRSKGLNDPKMIRALAHPLRLRIKDILAEEGPLTATELAERIGESPANCSFHLRTLAKYGFVEEAGGGKGRQRPWRSVPQEWGIDAQDLTGDAKRAAIELEKVIQTVSHQRYLRWYDEREAYPVEWRKAGFSMEFSAPKLTIAELEKLSSEIGRLLHSYSDRKEVPEGALPIRFTATAHPIGPAPDSSSETSLDASTETSEQASSETSSEESADQ